MNEEIFLAAQVEVADAIDKAVALAHGEPRRALGEFLTWVDAEEGRRTTVCCSVRNRMPDVPLPQLDALVQQALEQHGDERAGVVLDELLDPLENPSLCETVDREVGLATAAEIVAWVELACRIWREANAE